MTNCVHGREPVLGKVTNGEKVLSDWGCIADAFWTQVPIKFANVSVDMHVTMPNHVRAIIVIHDSAAVVAVEGGGTPANGLSIQRTRTGRRCDQIAERRHTEYRRWESLCNPPYACKAWLSGRCLLYRPTIRHGTRAG